MLISVFEQNTIRRSMILALFLLIGPLWGAACASGVGEDDPPDGPTVVAPNGGEALERGTTTTIQWATADESAAVTIELWQGGELDTMLASDILGSSTWDWSIPGSQPLGDDYRIRVRSSSDAALYDDSDSTFSIVQSTTPPPLTVSTPNGGESWQAGSSQIITWTTEGDVPLVDVELWQGGSWVADLATGLFNNDQLPWDIPPSQAEASDYRVRVVDASDAAVFDESDGDFAITPPNVTVTAPNGGETWQADGSVQTITWDAGASLPGVTIELWKGGALSRVVTTGAADTGSIQWAVPTDVTQGTDYRVRVASSADAAVYDESDADFTIQSWAYRRQIDIQAPPQTGATLPVLVVLDASFGYGSVQANGEDIRFSLDATGIGSPLPHWIEQWNVSGESWIWVAVPVTGGQVATPIQMYYGHPGAAAPTTGYADVFPGAYTSSGSLTLTGVNTYDWFELSAGDLLTVGGGQVLEIQAQRIRILGTISGDGLGYSVDAGPGPGGSSTDSGGGGGGYGGAGGQGGYDSGDSPGSGGAANGSASSADIDMGSGGGSTDSSTGGGGGGAVVLRAAVIEVNGAVTMDGADGAGSGRSGGGGAGGGVLVVGDRVWVSSALSASGGAGGSGGSTANDGGGGGGGGRIKIFFDHEQSITGSLGVGAGAGGLYGDTDDGDAGSAGTTHQAQSTYGVQAALGAEIVL